MGARDGLPDHGGLTPDEALEVVHRVATHRNVVGIDCMEVGGTEAALDRTAMHGARLLLAAILAVCPQAPLEAAL